MCREEGKRDGLSYRSTVLPIDFIYLQSFADGLGIPFIETSAKTAENVEDTFSKMAATLIKIRYPHLVSPFHRTSIHDLTMNPLLCIRLFLGDV